MIAIIDYKAGNIASVRNTLSGLGAEIRVSADPHILDKADGIIFPGVGHAKSAMSSLKENGLDLWLKQTSKPVLGICLGMQLLFERSIEGETECLGLIPGTLQKFDSRRDKVPHMGWNNFNTIKPHSLLKDIVVEDYFYYVHSYYVPVNDYGLAGTQYAEVDFCSVAAIKNYMGVQFHPEKSGKTGIKLLKNFLTLINKS